MEPNLSNFIRPMSVVAQEAINYIAQQEGMHFGNVLLGKEKGNNED